MTKLPGFHPKYNRVATLQMETGRDSLGGEAGERAAGTLFAISLAGLALLVGWGIL